MAANALPAGHAVQEYRIEKLLGVGGFGLTYLAIDQNLDLRVALKEYLPGDFALRAPDQSIVPRSEDSAETFAWGKRRFLDESRTLASFHHPNIVRVMRFFEASGSAYMVMEFVAGSALSEWMLRRRPLAEAQLAGLVRPLLEGLEVVHRAGYMHRDIKPANIYMRDDDSPVLIDFGSARQKASELTAVVSPGYAPFEQYHTHGKQGPWSDLYALGGVLYWIVTGNPPLEAAARIRKDTMPPAVQTGDRRIYRSEFLAAIDWALSPNEEDRPQSVPEWRDALLGPAAAPAPRTERLQAPVMPAVDPALLKRLEAELAQHLGPITSMVLKNAARKAGSQGELVQLLASELPDEIRAGFEKRFSGSSQPASRPGSAEPATVLAASRFPPEVLDRAEQRLAEYIGAVARIVVRRAAMKARDEAELYLLIADEIDDKAEKKAFIRQAVSISGKP